MVPKFSNGISFNDLEWPTYPDFKGNDNMQREITRLMVSRIRSIYWFRFQWPWVTLGLFKITGYYWCPGRIVCADARYIFAIAKLLLKVLLQKCVRLFPGQSLSRTDDSRTWVARTRRFPNRRFPDNTFFRAPFLPRMLCISAGYAVASTSSVRHVRVFCRNEQTYPTFFFSIR